MLSHKALFRPSARRVFVAKLMADISLAYDNATVASTDRRKESSVQALAAQERKSVPSSSTGYEFRKETSTND